MSSLGSPNPFFIAGKKAYEIERSLRVNDNDSAYLSRTPSSAGNRRTFTISVWTKRANLTGALFGSYISDSDRATLRFSSDYLEFQSSGGASVKTNAVFRDSSAWYHIVCAIDTTQGTQSNRGKLYVNGVQQELSSNSFSQDVETSVNNNSLHVLGTRWASDSANMLYDGYLAEVNLIDGLALDPSYFGATDAITGQWNPKKYGGGYGTNGFYLNFSDNSGTTATTLGKDSSGNGNNFTPNNFSVSAGAGNDSLEDSPTNNFPTINPLAGYSTNFVSASNGNLDFSMANNHWAISTFTIPASGKWYFECVFTDVQSGDVSVFNPNMINDDSNSFDGRWNGISFSAGEIRVDNSTVQSSLTSLANNTIYGILIDRDAGTVSFSIAGSVEGSAVNISSMTDSSTLSIVNRRQSSSGTNPIGSQNYGQRPFSHLPTGYKALSSANLPDPTILLPNKHFDTLLYTGNASTNNITGLEFQPDWLWIKSRVQAYGHYLWDTVRGTGSKALATSSTSAEPIDGTSLVSFNSDGFSFSGNSGVNDTSSGTNGFVAWNWNAGGSTVTNTDGSISSQVRANPTAGFSIIGYTGINGAGTIGHGLGVAPKAVIVRRRDSASDWAVYHGEIGNTKRLVLNSAAGESNASASWWNNTSPTSTTISLGSDAGTGGSTDNYIVYAFNEVAGYSKFGSYTGNGSDDGTFVFMGFKPAWIMIKMTSGSDDWPMYDNKRDPFNVGDHRIFANTTGAEGAVGQEHFDFVSNGIKFRKNKNPFNTSGSTYIYFAFAESPFKNARAR